MLLSLISRAPRRTLAADPISVRIRNPLFASFVEHANFDPRYRRVYRARERNGSRRLRKLVWTATLVACSGWLLAESAFGLSVF